MLIIVQIPFVDFRLLKSEEKAGCFFPNQFIERPGMPIYYRHFGNRHYRNNFDGLPQSEHSYFGSGKLLKLKQISDEKHKLVFSRLFADNIFFYIDIGIRVDSEKYAGSMAFQKLIQEIMHEDIFIAQKGYLKGAVFNINTIKQYVESLYLYATTHVCNYRQGVEKGNLYFGKPAVFCQYAHDARIFDNKNIKSISLNENVSIRKTTLSAKENATHLWLISKRKSDGETKDFLRRLRICILKLNSYREGLDGIFKYFEKQCRFGDISLNADIKLRQIKKLLKRDTYYGIEGKHIMDLALEKEKALHYESWDENIQKLNFYLSRIKKERNRSQGPEEVIMGDKIIYNAKQVGIQGHQAGAHATVVQLSNEKGDALNYADAINEIDRIKSHVRAQGVSDENDILIGGLSQLKQELEKKDSGKAIAIIKSIGGQVLDIAKRIGCPVIAGIISKNI